jgi:hypothetical protein
MALWGIKHLSYIIREIEGLIGINKRGSPHRQATARFETK